MYWVNSLLGLLPLQVHGSNELKIIVLIRKPLPVVLTTEFRIFLLKRDGTYHWGNKKQQKKVNMICFNMSMNCDQFGMIFTNV